MKRFVTTLVFLILLSHVTPPAHAVLQTQPSTQYLSKKAKKLPICNRAQKKYLEENLQLSYETRIYIGKYSPFLEKLELELGHAYARDDVYTYERIRGEIKELESLLNRAYQILEDTKTNEKKQLSICRIKR